VYFCETFIGSEERYCTLKTDDWAIIITVKYNTILILTTAILLGEFDEYSNEFDSCTISLVVQGFVLGDSTLI
jgi:hypothetical protein